MSKRKKSAAATLDAVAAKGRPADGGGSASMLPVLITRVAFTLTLALVIARALMSETIRSGFDVVPNGMPAPASPGPGATLFLNALCCLPALLVLARRALERQYTLRWTISQVLLALLALWSAASVAWSADRYTALINASTLIAAAVLVWSTQQLVRSWTRLRLVAGVALGLLLCYAVQGLIYKFVDVPDNIAFWNNNKEQILREHGWQEDDFQARQFARKLIGGEMVGFNTSPNSYAAVIVMLSAITIGAAIQRVVARDAPAWPTAILLAIPPALVVLSFTQTRTAFATFLLVCVALGLLALPKLRQRLATQSRLAYFAGLAAFALGVAAVVGHGVFHGSLPGASLNFRWRYWVAACSLFKQHALTGVGWGNFGNHYVSTRLAAAAEEVRDPHNFLVRTFVELGVIGGVIAIAWLGRAAWEASRPIHPSAPADSAAAPKPAAPAAVASILSIAAGGALLSAIVAIDWSQDGNFLILETFRRFLFLGLICVALLLVALRGFARPEIDDRPAPWLLWATLIGLGAFLVHNMVDFVIAEPGAQTLFAVLLGCVIGVRTPATTTTTSHIRRPRTAARIALSVAMIAWLAGVLTLVIPVADAEQRARDADNLVIKSDFNRAAGTYRTAFESVPSNADLAYRAARAYMFAGASPEQVKAMLGVAIATEPTNVSYLLTRAGYERQQPQPDPQAVRADIDAALRLDPHNISARLDYATYLESLGDRAAAARQIRAALETNRQYDTTEPKRLPPSEVEHLEKRSNSLESAPATTTATSQPSA
jgi:O-antigen ligase/tetratricopeptide (TPR) repeat protein